MYIFGDFCSGEVFGIRRFDDGRTTQAPLTIGDDIGQIVSFGEGPDGDVYVLESWQDVPSRHHRNRRRPVGRIALSGESKMS